MCMVENTRNFIKGLTVSIILIFIGIYIYIYIYIYIMTVMVVTKSLCGFVSNQVQYNMESAQYLG